MFTKRKILSIKKFTKKKHAHHNPMFRAAIIPHAGTLYAGEARESIFSKIKQQNKHNEIKKIIYISAIHNSRDIHKGIYEFSKDHLFGKTPHLEKLPDIKEHSFEWVEDELRQSFPVADIFVITPVKLYKHNAIQKWISNYMRKHKNCLLFSTTDLTHHGESYHNHTLRHPHRLHKQHYEEAFISELVKEHFSIGKIVGFVKQNLLLCGPFSVSLFMNVMKMLGMTGKVTDYYDSNFGDKKLNKYVILQKPSPNFVSYVSIIYGKGVQQNKLDTFDIMMAIGAVKSEIIKNLYNSDYTIRLPYWSPFYHMNQGVFVGTSIGKKTNCSYGRYELHDTSSKKYTVGENTATKIVEAAGDCVRDARDRWKLPYQIDDLDNLNYKIELLQPKKYWKEYPGKDVKRHFKMDGTQGIYLALDRNKSKLVKRAATYLPVVARENKSWTIEKYMDALSEKANGSPREWVDGTIHVYTSTSYTWNSRQQKLYIE